MFYLGNKFWKSETYSSPWKRTHCILVEACISDHTSCSSFYNDKLGHVKLTAFLLLLYDLLKSSKNAWIPLIKGQRTWKGGISLSESHRLSCTFLFTAINKLHFNRLILTEKVWPTFSQWPLLWDSLHLSWLCLCYNWDHALINDWKRKIQEGWAIPS